jgi:glycopeptide antibiotics resistance protein
MPDSATGSKPPGVPTIVLFVIYAVLVAGVILFKFPFQYDLTASGRELNLIPFAGSFANHRGIGEVVENVLIFVPLGIYISVLWNEWSFGRKTLTIAATSVALEIIQFASAIGRADITDVLCNTLGGLVGIGIYELATKSLRARSTRVLTIVEFVVTVVTVAFFLFLRAHSR